LDTTKKAVIRYCKNLTKFSETPPSRIPAYATGIYSINSMTSWLRTYLGNTVMSNSICYLFEVSFFEIHSSKSMID